MVESSLSLPRRRFTGLSPISNQRRRVLSSPPWIPDNGMGCPVLRQAVTEARPRVHVFGHVHGCRGHVQLGSTHFYNASLDARQTSQAAVVAASSHTISLPTVRPWVHELLRTPHLRSDTLQKTCWPNKVMQMLTKLGVRPHGR